MSLVETLYSLPFGFTTVLDTVLEPSIENMTFLCFDIMMKKWEGLIIEYYKDFVLPTKKRNLSH